MARRPKNGHDESVEGIDGQPTGEDGGRPAVNSAARAEIIREVCETIAEFDRQIDAVKAERKAVIETRIVADLGMKKGDFALAYKLHEMSHDERDVLLDTMRECFSALGAGEQLNWLDAAEGAPA